MITTNDDKYTDGDDAAWCVTVNFVARVRGQLLIGGILVDSLNAVRQDTYFVAEGATRDGVRGVRRLQERRATATTATTRTTKTATATTTTTPKKKMS
jgi:hypothetical protein